MIRPVYSGFLALAQGISGIGLQSVINWQVTLLAAIPALLYLLGKATHHRLTGLLLGILAILHENNSIALSGAIDVSNSKMIMSDFPTQLGVILFTLILLAWLKDPERKRIHPLLAGGMLGIFMLVRTQIGVLLIVLPLVGWLQFGRKLNRIWQPTLLLLLGLAFSLAPWVVRNLITSRSLLSDPEPAGIYGRYSSFDPQDSPRLPGESEEEYADRTRKGITRTILAQPLETARIFSGHYLNNHIATLFALPTSFPVLSSVLLPPLGINRPDLYWRSFVEQCCSLEDYAREALYWRLNPPWEMDFSMDLRLPLAANLLLICIGIGAVWRWVGWAGTLPLMVSLFYNMGNAVTRLSGWRFNLPVEWVGLLYYSAGLLQICFWIGMLFSNRLIPAIRQNQGISGAAPRQDRLPWKKTITAGLIFFTFVAIIPVAELAIPDHFKGVRVENLLENLEADGSLEKSGLDRTMAEEFLAQEHAVVYVGRALYPRFLRSKQGSSLGSIERFFIGYERMEFYLLPQKTKVIFRVESPPKYFPNASDILLVGCQRAEYIEAYLVRRIYAPNSVLARSEPREWNCKEP